MINTLPYWVLIGVISTVVVIWLFLVIYRRIRYEIYQVAGFLSLILALSFNFEFAFDYFVPLNQELIYEYVALALAALSLAFTFFGVVSANRRWVIRKGTSNLNRFRNLFFYAYIRHPITFGLMIICTAIILLIHTIFSNVFAILALISFMISSFEKDHIFEKTYGYPYKVYTNKVPRFNIILGILKSFLDKERKEENESKYIIYD